MKDFIKKLYEKILTYLEKNKLDILLFSGINLTLLYVIKYNFVKIKIFLNYIEKTYSFFRTESLVTTLEVLLFPFTLYLVSFRITNRNIKKILFFFGCTIFFQILSIGKENNNYTVSSNILALTMIWAPIFIFRKRNDPKPIFIIIGILFFIMKNQLDDFLSFNKIGGLRETFYTFRFEITLMIIIFFFFKFLYFIKGYSFRKKIKNGNAIFNDDKANFLKERIEKSKGILSFSFKNENIKNNFIYNIKRIHNQKYDIVYRDKSYYLNNWHFEKSLPKIKKKNKKKRKSKLYKFLYNFFGDEEKVYYESEKIKKRMLIIDIDNIEESINNEFENIKNKFKFDVLITLSMKDDLFSSRREDIKKLKENIDSEKNSILIDNIWGNGKTFFIKKFMDKYNDNFEFIYIKVPYFDTKMEFRKKILVEINRIFKKNNIITSSLKDLMSYFNINNENIKLGFMSFDFNKFINDNMYDDYREVLINIKNNLKYLKKKIVIILDDFDRMENKQQILEVLNFIGELNIELNESLTLITLSSYEKLISIMEKDENVKEGKKFLEKYFDKIFYLSNTNFFELIEFFLDVYDINLEKRDILKEIINLINKHNEKLLTNEKINFRNVERFIKRIKEMNIKLDIGIKEYRIIYEKIFILWEIIEYLIPDYWDELKKIDMNTENQKISSFYEYILQELTVQSNLKNIKSGNEKQFVFSILESVRKYKLGEYDNPIYYYLDIKEKMLKIQEGNKINRLWKYEDYQKVNEIFDFQSEERKKIFNFFMLNKDINKYETLELMIQYKLNYNWKYKNSMEFFKNLENKEEGELLSGKRTNGKFYIFLKNLLLVNLFIDINKMEKLEEQEKGLHSKNEATGYFLKSNEEFLNFFSPFLRKGIEEEYNNFIQEIYKLRTDTEQKTTNNIENKHTEPLKLQLVNGNYLAEDLGKNLEILNSLKNEIKNLEKKEQNEIFEYLKTEDQLLYQMWKNYLQNDK